MIIVSDCHLGDPGDARGQTLLRMLKNLRGESAPASLVLLGDVFDFCLGSRYFLRKFRPISDELERLADAGCHVIVFEGNHEFSLSRMGWRGVEIECGVTRVETLPSGRRVALSHGDLLLCDHKYRAFRALIKSAPIRFLAGLVPPRLMDAISLGHARRSRGRGMTRFVDQARLVAAAQGWLLAHTADLGVFGHYHLEIHEPHVAGGPDTLYCMPGWDTRAGYLIIEGRETRYVPL
jgi:UDP-2,3-diacylglucosamine pyrophosphatase LpxH